MLTIDIYKTFSGLKDYGFKDQVCRASVSVMNNIAEGFERKSHKDFEKFLYIAKGSCGEVRSLLALALDLRYINKDKYKNMGEEALQISRLLSGLIKSL